MLGSTVGLGHLAGIRIRAHWSVLVLLGSLTSVLAVALLPVTAETATPGAYWGAGAVGAVLIGCSLGLHALAHALVARRRGIRTDTLTLWSFGSVAERGTEPSRPRTDFAVALAGPMTSLVLGCACWAIAVPASSFLPPLALVTVLWLGLANLVVAGVSLLPGAPLDGGRMLRAVLWHHTGEKDRAGRLAGFAGQSLGIAFLAAGAAEVILFGQFAGIWPALLGWFVLGAAGVERRTAEVSATLGNFPVRELVRADQRIAPGWWTVAAFLGRESVPRRGLLPVVAFDGSAVGVVELADLWRLSADERGTTRMADVSRRPPAVPVIPADTPLSAILAGDPRGRPGSPLLVAQGSTFVGMLSRRDFGLVEPVGIPHR